MQSHHLNHHGPATILFTHYGEEWIRGSERCLLNLLSHLDRTRFKPVVWCNSKTMANQVHHLDIPVIRSSFPLLWNWQHHHFALRAFYNLIKQGKNLIDEHSVTLIHANSGAPNQWLNLVARARHIPLLTHLHSRYPLHDRMSLGLHQIPMVVGVSQPVIEQLLTDGMPPERMCVIQNGIDTQQLDRQASVNLRQMLNLGDHEFLIATTGSLIHRKGIDILIEAVSRLIKQNIPVQLVIIGDGPERANLHQQIKQAGLSNRIHLLGERSNVVGLLRGGVNLFVSAARDEAFGLALAEASLASLPVVAPKVGGIPDVIVDGRTGKLVPADDISALTAAIHQFYLDPQLCYEMGMAGRHHVLKHFTIQHNVRQFEQLYTRMLHDPAMQMKWYSHWQWRHPITNSSKQLFKLARNKFLNEITP